VSEKRRVLLLQIRNPHDPMREHEVQCFSERTALPRERVVSYDVVHATPSLAEVRAHDALMIGGSGEYYVSKRNQPALEPFFELLREVAAIGHPTFASCYGFQCMVAAHGGEVVHDPSRAEVGSYDLELTEGAEGDPLFGALPRTFVAQLGHKDRADGMPEGFVNLARSERVGFQALRVRGKPVWATQFHPELDHLANRHRYAHYLEAYSSHMSSEEKARSLEAFRPSPEASGLLRRFLDLL
jgi:GMP synthase (glutamine-hydrolysing)